MRTCIVAFILILLDVIAGPLGVYASHSSAAAGPIEKFTAALARDPSFRLARTTVPRIGCPSDGQLGPQPAPARPKEADVVLRKALRPQVAYYSALPDAGSGVLAPRNWSCFGTYGSAGSTLYVVPRPIEAPILDRPTKITAGPAIVLSFINGDTSGRFAMARIVARIFPHARAFAERVKGEHIDDPADYKFHPWPHDRIERLSANVVAYTTPPHESGLGTMEQLDSGPQPIQGLVMLHLGQEPYLIKLAIRLPATLRHLYPAISVAKLGENRSR